MTCHQHGHVCSTPRCRCQAGTRSPHMPDTRRRDPHKQAHHIQRWTAIGRRGHVHVTHKDAGTTGCTGYAQAGRPPAQMHPVTQEQQSITKTHTCHKVKPRIHRQPHHTQRSTRTPRRHAEAHTVTTHRHSTNGRQRTLLGTSITYTDTQTLASHTDTQTHDILSHRCTCHMHEYTQTHSRCMRDTYVTNPNTHTTHIFTGT